MKKLFNSRFLFILATSLIVLIILIVGAFYLFDNDDNTFVKSGYVLNPLSSTSEKYFFDVNVGYHENLSSMIEFIDVDNNDVSILKDSFIHYNDDSLSFLKNGAILDLDSLNGNKAVLFYNITNKSIIEKENNKYVINTASKDIELNNFIGRISDDKYIVVGDLNLKMAGNSTSIKGDYFEIVYTIEGVVNIENKDHKYQVTATDTYIYIGSDKVLDLGNKKIMVNDVDTMSITSITIDGNENIEIIPSDKEEDNNNPGTGNNPSNNGNQGTIDNGNNDTPNDGGNDSEDGEGTGTGDGNVADSSNDLEIILKDYSVTSTSIKVTFDILNQEEDDLFKLQVVSLSTGKTVDIVAEVVANTEIQVNLLTPNTKYLVMVINEKDNNKYYQKVFETSNFGIKLEKKYATSNSLVYNVIVEEGTDITNAKLTLYRFNEETMKNEVVVKSYIDSLTGNVISEEQVVYLSSFGSNIEGNHEVIFDGLDSDTIYTAVLDEFSLVSTNFKDIYNITLTSLTLKETPLFSDMIINKDVGEGSFELSLDNIQDPDNAIVSYTYMIYYKKDDTLAIDPIVNSIATPIKVNVGTNDNELRSDTKYYYKAVIEYYDNEKYIEYMTSDSIVFNMSSDPYITVVKNESQTTYTQIGATIYLRDNSCLIDMPGREECNGTNSTLVEVSEINSSTGQKTVIYSKVVDFAVDDNEIKYDLIISNLTPDTTYSIDVKAILNDRDSYEREELLHTEESNRYIKTKSFTDLSVEWTNMTGYEERPIIASTKLYVANNTDDTNVDDTLDAINKVVLKLYDGRVSNKLDEVQPIATASFTDVDFKEIFYNSGYELSSDETFKLSLKDLLARSKDGELNEYYTITIEAYYGEEKEITLINNIYTYRVASGLFSSAETILELSPITNVRTNNMFSYLSNDGTVVGYNVYAYYDRQEMIYGDMEPVAINYYVYSSSGKKISFYIMNENEELELVDKYTSDVRGVDSTEDSVNIYMDYGTSYETIDEIMRRGNSFYIGYEIVTESSSGDTSLYPLSNKGNSPTGYGMYQINSVEKETPSLKMYIATSTSNSITYNYKISDPDNAIFKEYTSDDYGFYYIIGNGVENKLILNKVEDSSYNQFAGSITIEGLKNNDIYSIYYKKNVIKSGQFDSDVLSYLDGTSTKRIFDGYYDLGSENNNYSFKYQIINNPLKDNKVVIKILTREDILDRILSYKLTFTTNDASGKGYVLNKELWELTTCSGDSDTDTPRCLSVDYIDLKNAGMKSDDEYTKLISVKVEAVYDNGLAGYDFKVGEGNDYLYTIFQDNSSEEGVGNYLTFKSDGQLSLWNDTLNVSKGYYTYKLNNALQLTYTSQLTGDETKIRLTLSSSGYSSKYGYLTPKMVSVDEMECTMSTSTTYNECNQFSFSSITPKISVSQKTAIINGSIMNLTLSGIDLNDLIRDDDGEYYLYVETWAKQSDAGILGSDGLADPKYLARPTLKVKINSSNPTSTLSAVIDGLKEYNYSNGTGSYYFNVYAYLNNGSDSYTQLFDASVTDGYVSKTYTFNSLKASDLFHTVNVSFTSSDTIYGNRSLNTKINLLAYKNSTAYNFDLIYVLCNVGDNKCGPEETDSHIFRKEIPLNKLSTMIEDSVDISDYDLEYGKNYLLSIYVSADYYNNGVLSKRNVLINTYDRSVKIRELVEPTFTVVRSAILEKDVYGIGFKITANDSDRTLVNGNYYIKLLDSQGSIVGNMMLLDANGDYYEVANYQDYAFDAFTINKNVRIIGLNPNTKYTFVVYNDAYLNNYSEDTQPGAVNRTYEVSKSYSVYSTNNYGVAFGDATYGVTEKSVVVTFLGGSNFDNVSEVNYTVGLWDDDQSTSTYSGTFVIGEKNKYFEMSTNSEDWRFIIDPTGMKNTIGKTYKISISFKVKIAGTDKYVVLTSADVPSFEGTVTYYEEDSK